MGARGWPRGKKRGPRIPKVEEVMPSGSEVSAVIEEQPALDRPLMRATAKPAKKVWQMKAGNNWDSAQIGEENPDRYYIPSDQRPEGMDLQWNTCTIYGQEMSQHINSWVRSGWTPIHRDDFDGLYRHMPADDAGFIKLDGMALCARPEEFSRKARARDVAKAREQISLKEQACRGGEINATGANHPSALAHNRITRSMERIEVPQE